MTAPITNISQTHTNGEVISNHAPPLLTVQGLSKTFGAATAVNPISFDIGEGRCIALLGPNGAGKTTTIRMLTGLLAQTTGTISFPGAPEGIDRRQMIGYLPQVPAFYGWMTGREFLTHSARLCGMNKKEAEARCESMLQRVGIADAAKRRIAGYSGGMKQRLGLAQALIHRPKLLILDEPVSALDPIGRREVMELLNELKQETTVLFSTHVLHDAEELCDDVLIMQKGRLAISGSMNSLRDQHRQSVLIIETEGDPKSKAWLAGLLKQPSSYIQSSILLMNGNGAKLIVHDVDLARRDILTQALSEEVQVTRLEFGYSTLEDLFMRVVSEA